MQPFGVKFTATPHTNIQHQSHSYTTYKKVTSKSQRHHMQTFNVKFTATPYAANLATSKSC